MIHKKRKETKRFKEMQKHLDSSKYFKDVKKCESSKGLQKPP